MSNRRNFIKRASYGSLSLLLLQQSFLSCSSKNKIKPLVLPSQATYNMKYLTGNVGIFTERGGTIAWMVNKDGVAIVDTQFPDQANHLIDQIKMMTDNPFKAVINTHHHGDHTAGNMAFKEMGTTIIAHENSRANQERSAQSNGKDTWLPNSTFKNNYKYTLGDDEIAMHYFGPGHTDGDIAVHFTDQNVVHIGDLVFNRRFPYIDKGSGAMIENWIVVLDQIKAQFSDNTIFVWGHAAEGYNVTGDKEDIKAFQNYLEKLLVYGAKCIKAGKTEEEAGAVDYIPGAPEWKGDGIMRSINAVYQELQSYE